MVQFGDVYRFARYKLLLQMTWRVTQSLCSAGYVKISSVKSGTNNTFSIIYNFWFSILKLGLVETF